MPNSATDGSLAVRCVRSLLERQGLPKYRQSAWLAKAFGLSYAQAHRRLNGASPWSLDDLAQLAGLFGETLADLVSPESQAGISASLQTGGETLSCRIWLGDSISVPPSGSVFAVRSKSGWVVATNNDRVDGEAFSITRLEARPATDRQRRVAVLDDDPDVTDSIVSNFQLLGYRAQPFYRTADLLECKSRFDCFVLDWVVGDKTVLELVRSLRSANATCLIVILTAQVASGAISETDIADAMKHYDLLFFEKPIRTSILAATLSRAFAHEPERV